MSNSFQRVRKPVAVSSIAELGARMVHRLPGATDEEIRRALQSAYGDFCRLTSVFTHVQEIEIEADEREYPVVPYVPECFVDSVVAVALGRRKLKVGRDFDVRTSPVVTVVLSDRLMPDTPTPEQIAAHPEFVSPAFEVPCLRVTAIELPRLGSERAPRWFFDKYGEAVSAGAFVKLFGMTNKPWTDGAQAQHELVRWENYVTEARLRGVADGHSTSGCGALDALDTSVLL